MHVFGPAVLLFMTLSMHAWAQQEEPTGDVSQDVDSISANDAAELSFYDQTPTQRLEAGIRLYQTGESETAQAQLAALANDPSYTDIALRQRTRVFLGEVLYLNQQEEQARRVFERILTVDSSYVIDPFQHPPDVCGFFETIRAYIRPEEVTVPVAIGPMPPIPAVGYLGFGVYQMRYGRTNIGTIMLVSQAAFGALSVSGAASLLEEHTYEAGNQDDQDRMTRRRNAQWVSTALFYGIWTWGIFDAGKHWRASVSVAPGASAPKGQSRRGPPGMELRIDGRFGR